MSSSLAAFSLGGGCAPERGRGAGGGGAEGAQRRRAVGRASELGHRLPSRAIHRCAFKTTGLMQTGTRRAHRRPSKRGAARGAACGAHIAGQPRLRNAERDGERHVGTAVTHAHDDHVSRVAALLRLDADLRGGAAEAVRARGAAARRMGSAGGSWARRAPGKRRADGAARRYLPRVRVCAWRATAAEQLSARAEAGRRAAALSAHLHGGVERVRERRAAAARHALEAVLGHGDRLGGREKKSRLLALESDKAYLQQMAAGGGGRPRGAAVSVGPVVADKARLSQVLRRSGTTRLRLRVRAGQVLGRKRGRGKHTLSRLW